MKGVVLSVYTLSIAAGASRLTVVLTLPLSVAALSALAAATTHSADRVWATATTAAIRGTTIGDTASLGVTVFSAVTAAAALSADGI